LAVELHKGDLRGGIDLGSSVAIDTETMGLNPFRDRLCLVQLCDSEGHCHLIQFPPRAEGKPDYSAPNLKALLADQAITKLFHFARFDVATLAHHLGVWCERVYCTKIASKIARTNADRHGLKDLCRGLLGIEVSKQMQLSDWGREELTPEQLEYASEDVRHLHGLRERLDELLEREGRAELAASCFRFVPTRVRLDLAGWQGVDIFEH